MMARRPFPVMGECSLVPPLHKTRPNAIALCGLQLTGTLFWNNTILVVQCAESRPWSMENVSFW